MNITFGTVCMNERGYIRKVYADSYISYNPLFLKLNTEYPNTYRIILFFLLFCIFCKFSTKAGNKFFMLKTERLLGFLKNELREDLHLRKKISDG